MAMQGLGKNQELDSGALLRDARPLGRRVAESLSNPEYAATLLFILGGVTAFFPQLWEVASISGVGFYAWFRRFETSKWQMPFRMPVWLKTMDPGEPAPGTKKPSPAGGICYIGNERNNFPGSNGEQIWATNSDMRTHMLVFGTTGAGKAQPLDAKVHTPEGWRRMGDLQRGDLVSTPSGGVSRIDGVFPQGEIAVYKFVFEDGRTTQACGNHLWSAQFKPDTVAGKKVSAPALPKVVGTAQMMKVLEGTAGRFMIPLPQPVERKAQALPLEPYLMGYFLAHTEFGARNLSLTCEDEGVLKALRAACPASMALLPVKGVPHKYWVKWLEEPEGGRGVHPLRAVLSSLMLDKVGARTRFIPQVYLEGSVAQRKALLRGLLDSAGAVYPKRGVNFVCYSEKMALEVQDLVRSLGGISSVWTRFDEITPAGVTRTTHPTFQVSIKLASVSQYFAVPKLKALASQLPDPAGLFLKSITPAGVKAAQCIHIESDEHLYVTDDYVVTHNTEALTSIATNALSWASGFIYVDGKADSSLYAKIYAMARKMGRDDDMLVINLMTGSMDITQVHKVKMSNTMNPFSTGSADFLTQMIVSLMSESGGDNAMWKDRAISLVSGLMGALCYMRDHEGLLLNTGVIREYLNFPKLFTLYQRRAEFPAAIGAAISGYVKSLPGFLEKNRANQSEDTLKQHGFLEMQFTRIMGSLADTYGHIFMHELAEVDLEDVVLNRRILVVLLPSLEKSPDELRNLGNIVVAALRAMMAKTLGAKIEGEYSEVVEAKPTNAPSPYFAILDEYGYYAVKGAAVMFAQARSLGFSMVVAGQDRQALDKASKEEAGSIIANCKIKVSMALEDPTDTFDLFSKAAGETYVSQVSGFSANTGGLMVSYNDMGNASLEKRTRLTLQELKDLSPGEAVVMVGSKIIRSDMFFANIPKAKRGMRINRFLKVKPPSVEDLSKQGAHFAKILDNLASPSSQPPALQDDLSVISDYFAAQQASGFGVKERAIGAFMAYIDAGRRLAQGFVSSLTDEPEAGSAELGGGASALLSSSDSFDGGAISDDFQVQRGAYVRQAFKVDESSELVGRPRRARAAISDDEPVPVAPVPFGQEDKFAASFASEPEGSEPSAAQDVGESSGGAYEDFVSSIGKQDAATTTDFLNQFEALLGSATGTPSQDAPAPAEPALAPVPAERELPAGEDIGLGELAKFTQGLGAVGSDFPTPASQQPARADGVDEVVSDLASLGDADEAGRRAEAIEALAIGAGYKDTAEMRDAFVDVELDVGGVDRVAATVNADTALQTIGEAVEEYPHQPVPPPTSAANLEKLLSQFVESYEQRSEPADEEGSN